jgi:hypothetical protein
MKFQWKRDERSQLWIQHNGTLLTGYRIDPPSPGGIRRLELEPEEGEAWKAEPPEYPDPLKGFIAIGPGGDSSVSCAMPKPRPSIRTNDASILSG